jgi:putative membrane protein
MQPAKRSTDPWSALVNARLISCTPFFGSSFICLGMLALVAAVIQHTRILQRLEAADYAYNALRPIDVTVAIMLLMIGASGLLGILL